MSNDEHFNVSRRGLHLTWLQFVGGAFALLVASVGATWAIRIDRLEQMKERVAAYEQSEKWALPDTLAQIRIASKELSKNLVAMDDIRKLRSANAQLARQVAQLQASQAALRAELQGLRVQIAERDKRIAAMYPTEESFRLVVRQSKSFSGHALTVGLVSATSSTATLNVNNDTRSVPPGAQILVQIGQRQCKLVLDTIIYMESPEKADLTLVCPHAP